MPIWDNTVLESAGLLALGHIQMFGSFVERSTAEKLLSCQGLHAVLLFKLFSVPHCGVACCQALSKYFAQAGRLRTAEFFFKRCLSLASQANWLSGTWISDNVLLDVSSACLFHQNV